MLLILHLLLQSRPRRVFRRLLQPPPPRVPLLRVERPEDLFQVFQMSTAAFAILLLPLGEVEDCGEREGDGEDGGESRRAEHVPVGVVHQDVDRHWGLQNSG